MKPRAWIVEYKKCGEWWPSRMFGTRDEAQASAKKGRGYQRSLGYHGNQVFFRVREYVPKEKP